MVDKGKYLEFVKTLDNKVEYSTSMEIIIELSQKIEELETKNQDILDRLNKLEAKKL